MALVVYKTHWDLCLCSFNITVALLWHRLVKHSQAETVSFLPFYKGEEVIQLLWTTKKGCRSATYKEWIGGVVDSVNSCLHPKAPGKSNNNPIDNLWPGSILISMVNLSRGKRKIANCDVTGHKSDAKIGPDRRLSYRRDNKISCEVNLWK